MDSVFTWVDANPDTVRVIIGVIILLMTLACTIASGLAAYCFFRWKDAETHAHEQEERGVTHEVHTTVVNEMQIWRSLAAYALRLMRDRGLRIRGITWDGDTVGFRMGDTDWETDLVDGPVPTLIALRRPRSIEAPHATIHLVEEHRDPERQYEMTLSFHDSGEPGSRRLRTG